MGMSLEETAVPVTTAEVCPLWEPGGPLQWPGQQARLHYYFFKMYKMGISSL